MTYDSSDDPYIDPRTCILRNKVHATTQSQLGAAEADITYVTIFTLTKGSRVDRLKFDATLLCDMHKEIFGDIYDWAGRIRTHDISKDWAYFAHAAYIQKAMSDLLESIEDDGIRAAGSRTAMVGVITHYYAELNAIHPFREGNGRTIRTFLRLFALKYGYDIDWSVIDKDENIVASEQSLRGDMSLLHRMIDNLLRS